MENLNEALQPFIIILKEKHPHATDKELEIMACKFIIKNPFGVILKMAKVWLDVRKEIKKHLKVLQENP